MNICRYSNIYIAKYKDAAVLEDTIKRVNSQTGHFTHPCMSPDGTKLAYWGIYHSSWDVFVADLQKGTSQNLTQGSGTSCHPAWSADSKSLAFAHSPDKTISINPYESPCANISPRNLWIINLLTGKKNQLTFNTSDSERPAWSPDGKSIAYVLSSGNSKNICILDLNTLQSRQITHDENIYYKPAWHPFKNMLAFNNKGAQNHYIWTINTDASDLKQITPFANTLIHDHGAFWSPSGSSILYHTDRSDSWQLRLINTNTCQGKVINFPGFCDVSHGSFDKEQRFLAFDAPQ